MLLQAINSLRPGAEWSLNGSNYDDIVWHDNVQTKPSKSEIEAEITRLQNDFVNKEYQRNREKEYPKIADQLDMLWHAINTNSLDKTSDFYLTLKTVKDNNPK
jgi:hypothetical protein